MSIESIITPIYEKVDRENRMLLGWYGDVLTPVQVRWDDLTAITQHRLVHAHDIESGKCKKNRSGRMCK